MTSLLSSTPCPIPNSLDRLLGTNVNETTSTFNFTTEVRATFRDARPRRQRQSVQFQIHEDGDEKRSNTLNARASLLQPPRRMQNVEGTQRAVKKVNAPRKTATEEVNHEHYNQTSHVSSTISQAPKRPATRPSLLLQSTIEQNSQPLSPTTEIVRQPRRGTIFIPNDDTTMPSMYMGIFSPIKDIDLSTISDNKLVPPLELTGIAAQMAMKRTGRKSILGGQARRGPLKPSLQVVQESASIEDRYGQGGGKENVPPNAMKKNSTSQAPACAIDRPSAKRASLVHHSMRSVEGHNLSASTASSVLRREAVKESVPQTSQPKPAWNGGSKLRQSGPVPIIHKNKPAPSSSISALPPKPRVHSRFVVPAVCADQASQNYAVLEVDHVNPALYEEDWLQYQEAAITQLVNNIFQACKREEEYGHETLRDKMLTSYDTPKVLLLHTRLQAALLYGTLAIPQDTLEQGARLYNDVGLRKRFTDLWLCTYNHSALESALEVVVGRKCRSRRIHKSVSSGTSLKVSKSGLRSFIETFLVRNEDVKLDVSKRDHIARNYQKTVLRSLLLIKLLDSIKSERPMMFRDDLFLHSSSFKSSVAVIQALMQMLNPAAGDPVRNLGFIDYHVSHVQDPLEEFEYCIENIAVDLRDGVRLVRLVELLLYPSTSPMLDKCCDSETTTIFMPEGETLEFSNDRDWPLSQLIKMSCQSRVVKVWNVQLALSAIKTVKGMGAFIDGITAEDIVDGFREKTIKLLWALVGKCGLNSLINWQDVKWEIRRLENRSLVLAAQDIYDDDFEEDGYSFQTCKALLRRWARAVAVSKGVEIHNFTTNFSDGRVFEAILDEYETYLHGGLDERRTKKMSLRDRLDCLGCSNQFSELFVQPRQTLTFDRDFVLASLAFLCSRLLTPSRRSRAATVIQGAWRKHWSKIESSRRREKKSIAMACANMIRSKQEPSGVNPRPHTDTEIATAKTPFDRYPGTMSLASTNGTISPNSEADIWLTL